MADWYIAPDLAVVPGLVFANIGVSGYGHTWNKAVRWSEFQNASGCWANRANGDVFHFLCCNREYKISAVAGWVTLTNNKTGLTFQAELMDGRIACAIIKGTRDWPWPKAGNTATYAGETFMQLSSTATTPKFKGMHFKHCSPLVTSNNGTTVDYGLIEVSDMVVLNSPYGPFTMQTKTDGRAAFKGRRIRAHGISANGGRIWGNDSDPNYAVDMIDCWADSEHQNTHSNFNNAQSASFIHLFDAVPQVQAKKSPVYLERCIGINFAAGYTGSGYPQGDPFICEENAGSVTAKDILTWGSGDRGIDLKCSGIVLRHHSLGDGTGAIGHHLDTQPVSIYQQIAYAGARLTTTTGPPNCGCIQSSGWTKSYLSYYLCRPSAAQVALAPYGAILGAVDGAKFQDSLYGGIHQGKVELIDCIEVVRTSAGATESRGFTTSGNNGRTGPVFGLTPSSSYNFKVRAVDPTGVAGAFTSLIPYSTSNQLGDSTGPAAPTGFVATPQTGGTDFVFTWNQIAEDAGTSIQGYIVLCDFGDGNGFIPLGPAKSSSPLRLSGFKPATNYAFKLAAYDSNMNLGTATASTGTIASLSGSVSASTPSVPLNCAVDGGWSYPHPTACGIGKAGSGPSAGWDPPASGVAAYYEVWKDGGGGADVLMTRTMSVPGTGSAPVLTKTNVELVTT